MEDVRSQSVGVKDNVGETLPEHATEKIKNGDGDDAGNIREVYSATDLIPLDNLLRPTSMEFGPSDTLNLFTNANGGFITKASCSRNEEIEVAGNVEEHGHTDSISIVYSKEKLPSVENKNNALIVYTPPILCENIIMKMTKSRPPSSFVEDDITLATSGQNPRHLDCEGIEAGDATEDAPFPKGLQNNVATSNFGSRKEITSNNVKDNLIVTGMACKNSMGCTRGDQKTELEREMEIYEEAEASLLSPFRNDQTMGMGNQAVMNFSTGNIQSERKRGQETELTRQRTKRGRKVQESFWEDVCFACFDGGELILCERRSCPKAYHVECTGRDPDFFAQKGTWFCGWHFCVHCSRSAIVHCYTCSNALCLNCIRESEFLCIRKNEGLCDSCFPIAKMIECSETVNAGDVQVDFNDEETYEYFYKYYWNDLKNKISLTWEEVEKAQKAKGAGEKFVKKSFNDTECISEVNNGSGSDLDVPTIKRRKQSNQKRLARSSIVVDDDIESDYNSEGDEEEDDIKPKRGRTRARKFDGWATKELLDFLQLKKDDRKKPLPLFVVNALLGSYIENNKLQNALRSSQIVCDEKLQKLFGKRSVERSEMTELLSSHLAPKRQKLSKNKETQAINDDDIPEVNHGEDKWDKGLSQKQHKPRKKLGEIMISKADPNDFAAVDVKNINLIYLTRDLLEDLLDDPEFTNKVVGAFVRIRVPSRVNKNDSLYRLVQVVGVKFSNPGSSERRMTDVVLEILNLQKREEVTIDLVSNQGFTEEECQRLRQCIKCGFLKAMTVGELEEKAKSLQEAKVKDWFDSELLRLSHLRDRASEKGHRKELRECVEKLKILKETEEKKRRLKAQLRITADPCMDPNFESDVEDATANDKQGSMNVPPSSRQKGEITRTCSDSVTEKTTNQWRISNNSFNEDTLSGDSAAVVSSGWDHKAFGREREVNYNEKKPSWLLQAHSLEYNNTTHHRKKEVKNVVWDDDLERNNEGNHSDFIKRNSPEWGNQNAVNRRNDPSCRGHGNHGYHTLKAYGKKFVSDIASSDWCSKRDETPQVRSTVSVANAGSLAAAAPPVSATVHEREKIWHYQDPTGKIQGPFSMEQLRKWEKTKLFPLDLKIWKASECETDSIFLMDVLTGKFSENSLESPFAHSCMTGRAFGRGLKVAPIRNVPRNNLRVQPRATGWDKNGTKWPSSAWNDKVAWDDDAWTINVSTKLDSGGQSACVSHVEGGWGQHVATETPGAADSWGAGKVPETHEGWEPGKMPEIDESYRPGNVAEIDEGCGSGKVVEVGKGLDSGRMAEAAAWGPGKVPTSGRLGYGKVEEVDEGWGPTKVPDAIGWGHAKVDEGRGPAKVPDATGWGHAKVDEGRGPAKVPDTTGWGHAKVDEVRGPAKVRDATGWGHAKVDERRGPAKVRDATGWGHAKVDEGWGPAKVPDVTGWGHAKVDEGWGPAKVPDATGWGHAKVDEVPGPAKVPDEGRGPAKVPDATGWGHAEVDECRGPAKVPDATGWGHAKVDEGRGPAKVPDATGWGHAKLDEGPGPVRDATGWGHAKVDEGWGPAKVPDATGWGHAKVLETTGLGSGKVSETGGWGPGGVQEIDKGWGHCKVPDTHGCSSGKVEQTGRWGPGKVEAVGEGWESVKLADTAGWGPPKVQETGGLGSNKVPAETDDWCPEKVEEINEDGCSGRVKKVDEGCSGKVEETGSWGPGKVETVVEGWESVKLVDTAGWGPPKVQETGVLGFGKVPADTGGWCPEKVEEFNKDWCSGRAKKVDEGWSSGKVEETGRWGPAKVENIDDGWGPGKVLDTAGWEPPKVLETSDLGSGKVPETSDWGSGKVPENEGWCPGKVEDTGDGWRRHKGPDTEGWYSGKVEVMDEGWGRRKVPETGSWRHGKVPDTKGRGWSGFTAERGSRGNMPFRDGRSQDRSYRDASQYRNDRPGFEFRNSRRNIPCKYFGRGICRKGPDCNFMHHN